MTERVSEEGSDHAFDPAVSHLTARSPRIVGTTTGYGLDRDLRIAGAEVHRMKALIGTTLVAAFVLISGSVVGAQVSIGIQIGPPPPPRVVYVAPPPPPQPEYVWVEGYWYPVERRYVWHDGYWTRPPYAGAHWVAARTTEGCTWRVTGTDLAAGSNMIIDGTPTTIGTTTPATATAMAAAVDIADNSQRRNCYGACAPPHYVRLCSHVFARP